jgi:hypothetical protein
MKYGYDVNDWEDRGMVLDLPFSQLNKKGRRAKKKFLKADGIINNIIRK